MVNALAEELVKLTDGLTGKLTALLGDKATVPGVPKIIQAIVQLVNCLVSVVADLLKSLSNPLGTVVAAPADPTGVS